MVRASPKPEPSRGPALMRGSIAAGLSTIFNILVLNLAFVLTSVPIVTAPLAINAAFVALDRWKRYGEDRVLRQFLTALRSSPALRTTVVDGVPLLAVSVGLVEVRYFAASPHIIGQVCFGLGLTALLSAMSALGYVFLLTSRTPAAAPVELWSLAARLAARNILSTGLLAIAEIASATFIGLVDPPLCLIGLPITMLYLVYRTTAFGLRRLDRDLP